MVPKPVPEDLQREIDRVAVENEPRLLRGEYETARREFEKLYNLLLSRQPDDGRYHKGYPAHNIGYALMFERNPAAALPWFLRAYIEDLLSQPLGEESRAREAPAYKVLASAYHTADAMFKSIEDLVRSTKGRGEVIKDPDQIRKPLMDAILAVVKAEVPKSAEQARKEAGQFDEKWEKRVFIGMEYKDWLLLQTIRDIVKSLGYEPVIVADYRVPKGLEHHHSLMILHECRYAIFELTHLAGQVLELERARDYGIPVLVVHTNAASSEMVAALMSEIEITPKVYRSEKELLKHIAEFLAEQEARAQKKDAT